MRLDRLWLTDFRSYATVDVTFPAGLTVIVGDNGAGKTNLLEAIAFLSTTRSFRGVPNEALVRVGAERAVVRAEIDAEGRSVLIEAEVAPRGGSRVQVNRQRTERAADLLDAWRVTVFAPDDMALIKGGPAGRRRFLDESVAAEAPRLDGPRRELDRVLRQRTALLRQAGGRLTEEVATTLDVWDDKLAEAGEQVASARSALLERLGPELDRAHRDLVGGSGKAVELDYHRSWTGPLREALVAGRDDDVRRRMTLRGPHRDDLVIGLDGLPARTHASQGEQRSLALALRLAVHRLVAGVLDQPPVLLLDDVFSELDDERAHALLAHLPEGQGLVTTAGHLPAEARPAQVLQVIDGDLVVT